MTLPKHSKNIVYLDLDGNSDVKIPNKQVYWDTIWGLESPLSILERHLGNLPRQSTGSATAVCDLHEGIENLARMSILLSVISRSRVLINVNTFACSRGIALVNTQLTVITRKIILIREYAIKQDESKLLKIMETVNFFTYSECIATTRILAKHSAIISKCCTSRYAMYRMA